MPSPVATTMTYALDVEVALQDNKTVNFADSADLGHRIPLPVRSTYMSSLFNWSRAVGTNKATAAVNNTANPAVIIGDAISARNGKWSDLDGVSGGLDFTNGVMLPTTNTNVTPQDWILQYILWKVYGASNYDTSMAVFDLVVADSLLNVTDIGDAIAASLNAASHAGSVDKIFQDLVAADPNHFYENGVPIPGVLNYAPAATASHGPVTMVAGDILEFKLVFKFGPNSSVTRSELLPGTSEYTTVIVIPANSTFRVRLQLTAD